jgi:hypothetical protein
MRRIQQREKMIDGILKMEADVVKGMAYLSGIRIQGDNEGKEGELDCQAPATKKARTKRTSSSKSTTRESNQEGCKCGQRDQKRITSSKCPWKGLCAEEVSAKYEQRMRQQKMSISSFSECTAEPCANGTAVNAQSSSKYMVPMRTSYVPHANTHLVQLLCTIVQKRIPQMYSRLVSYWSVCELLLCNMSDMRTHENSPGTISTCTFYSKESHPCRSVVFR